MPSSISSSSLVSASASLRSIAVAAIAAMAFYAALIEYWAPPVRAGQDQQSDNLIAIEHFLYDAPPSAVIVGSSMAGRIPLAALGPDVGSLALAGQSPLVGLDIIARSGRTPGRIYVEINNIAGPADETLVDSVFAQPGFTLKRYVKALRRAYQPVNLAISLLRRAARGRDEVDYPRIEDASLHETLITLVQTELNDAPDAEVLARNLAEMTRLTDSLAGRGAEIVFFEMPIDPQLEATPAVTAVRQAVHVAFPRAHNCWNGETVPTGLSSTDGIHLDSNAAANFGTSLTRAVCSKPQAHHNCVDARAERPLSALNSR
jgi:hypothetical protein